ncbi:hypothetical protein CLUG_05889 [Clavispora lusitaniae ATCC 42720]|uniref:Uncharacterized protein n=1 Tax=Clavispora lusitaniae (strain ATCC 42720) TaxID=306902 RepID=C4YC72_CLAL4|nr:uncharacterized protein CLUG_05889 [Clavispora lusitaniae ATCC 42720]EEQ41761.1 hypothetical protein CLUG_05889 [Clavispora lusitaniae ATCC 42720]
MQNSLYPSLSSCNKESSNKFITVSSCLRRRPLPTYRTMKIAVLGLSQMATCPSFSEGNYKVLLLPTLEQLCKNLSLLQGISKATSTVGNTITGDAQTASVAVNELDLESSAYGSTFSRLVSIQLPQFDPLPQVTNEDFKAIKLGAMSNIQKLAPLGVLNSLSEEAKVIVSSV